MPALELAMRVGRALGLAPYDYSYIPSETPPGRRGKYKLNSRHRCVRMALLLLLLAPGIASYAVWRPHAVTDGFSVLTLTRLAGPVLNACWTYSFLPLLWWRQHPLLLQVLNSDLFRSLPALPRRKILVPSLHAATFLVGLAVSVAYHWRAVFTDSTAVWNVSLLLFVSILHVNTALFVFLVSCVLTHVDAINDSLQEMAGNAAVAAHVIVSLRRRHREAFEATEKLSSALGLAVLSGFMGDSVWLVQSSFILIAARSDSVVQSLVQLIDILKTVVCNTITIVMAHILAKQANYTTLTRIHAVTNSTLMLNKGSRRELQEFSLEICQQPIFVSVNRVVVLNLPFYLQVLGVMATYVVVLLQFQQNMC